MTMKRGYYIHFQGRSSVGISKKIDMQMEEFQKHFAMREVEVETPVRTLPERVIGLFPTLSIKRNYEKAFEQIQNPDFLYVRRTVADRAYVQFWKKIKERYPDCKIIIEIFTYPYDKDDFGKWNAWPFYLKERIYRPKLKKYVDRFVTYSDDEVIFGIPTIRAINGITVEAIRRVSGQYAGNELNLIGVAYMQRQHGYERVIEGLYHYYRENKSGYQVNLLLVGDGPEKRKYQKLVKQWKLEEHVAFYPTMGGEELDRLYDKCDIALICFGMYKVGYEDKVGALKSRECLAKGMLMLSGSPIDVLDDDYPYLKLFPNDKSAVNIQDVVDYFKAVVSEVSSKEELAKKIRKYAENKVSMDVALQPIVDYVDRSK